MNSLLGAIWLGLAFWSIYRGEDLAVTLISVAVATVYFKTDEILSAVKDVRR